MDYMLLNAVGILAFSAFGLWAFYHAGKRKKPRPPMSPPAQPEKHPEAAAPKQGVASEQPPAKPER